MDWLDDGYHKFGNNWWTNQDCPKAYTYADLDASYSKEYFDQGSHPDGIRAEDLYFYMQEIFSSIFKRPFQSVLEIGGGSGELTKQFDSRELFYLVMEGTKAGYDKLVEQGIPPNKIIFQDLRRVSNFFTYPKFDMVVCTEVAEHIEPWFASKVVELCVSNADIIWFSAADQNRLPHYHHPNEAPIEAWDKMFKFFNFDYGELDGRHDRADRLYYSSAN